MKTYKATVLAAAMAAASLGFGGTANAAPAGAIAKAVNAEQTTNLQQVHYRKHHKYHKHRHYSRKSFRHRGYGHYRGYKFRPGFSLYIGPRYGYYGHRRYWR